MIYPYSTDVFLTHPQATDGKTNMAANVQFLYPSASHKSVWIFCGVFEVVSLKTLKKRIKKTAKLFIIIQFMPFGKGLWKNGLLEPKTKGRTLEGTLTSCSGLERLKFSL